MTHALSAAGGFVLALLLVAAVVGVRALTGSGGEPVAEDAVAEVSMDSEDAAIAACREAVADQLKNPASAEFDDEIAEQGRNDISWEVTGTVRSTNGFGGVVPATFTCYATWQGDHFTGSAELA